MSKLKGARGESDSSSGTTPRKHKTSEHRRERLIRIAYRMIARNGLEGFRTRQVAVTAGIDTGTLHYHYPSKELLIQAVVDRLVSDLRKNRAESGIGPATALEELHNEIRDVAIRVGQSPEQFRVLIDLRLHATRNRAIAGILANADRSFHQYLANLFSRGIAQNVFSADLDVDVAAAALGAQLIGISFMALQNSSRAAEVAATICNQWNAVSSHKNRS